MSTFWFHLDFGFDHILDWQGYDHMLFLLVLCAGYPLEQWRRILILVTAFTLGHSLTLGLGAYGVRMLPGNWVEFLIPLTILLTAIDAWLRRDRLPDIDAMRRNYLAAGLFGLIHGMGFSGFFLELNAGENLLRTWLPFNLGIELGQLLFVLVTVLLGWDLQRQGGLQLRYWKGRLAILAGLVSFWLIWERWPLG